MFRKYIVSVVGAKPYITKFYIKLIDDTLRFYYDIYLLKNPGITSMVEGFDQTFRSNPESDNVFEKLPKEKKFSHNISQLEAYSIIEHLENIIKNRNTINSEYIQVNLPRATLYYEIEKIQLLYNFIKNFYDNYEIIKLSYNKTENAIVEEDNNKKLLNDSNDINKEELSSYLFNEFTKHSPNNLITFFIIKNLLHFENANITNFKYDESNKNLYIQVNEFTDNYSLFYNDLITLINFNNINNKKEEIQKILKSKINNIIKIIIYIYEHKDHLNQQELYLYLSFSLILIYIHGYILSGGTKSLNIYRFSNRVIEHIIELNSSRYKNIKFFGLGAKQKAKVCGENKLNIDTINELSKKYQYLIDIDRKIFIKSIINDNEELEKNELSSIEENKKNLLNKLILSKPKLIDLDSIETKNPPLRYKKINNKISSNVFITKAYEDLHFIINSNNILPSYDFDKYLPKLSDLIINKIIPKITKYNEMIKLNPNTLLIYNEFIEPFIDNNIISIDEKLYLIYDICIPYLYDVYKINKILDYFH